MIEATTERMPQLDAVWREQLRMTWLAMRREVSVVAVLLAGFCLFLVLGFRVSAVADVLDIPPTSSFALDPGVAGFGMWGVVAALVLPFLVWRGERPFGDTPLWSLPVDHRRHALTKVATGWVWLMLILVGALALLATAVVAAGGSLGVDEVRRLVVDRVAFAAGEVGGTRDVPWSTPWWEWIIPFTSATAVYLLVSALWLGTRHPFIWAIALYVLTGAGAGLTEYYQIDWLENAGETTAWFIGAEEFSGGVRLASGEFSRGWSRMPSMGLWLASAAIWIGLGVAGVLAASARRRDH